jgi:hypothetical protein
MKVWLLKIVGSLVSLQAINIENQALDAEIYPLLTPTTCQYSINSKKDYNFVFVNIHDCPLGEDAMILLNLND